MAFITDAALKTAYADLIKTNEAALPSTILNIVAQANVAAYGDILRALIARGYTKAQVDTWVDGPTFNRDIGLYWTILKANGVETLPVGTQATWGYLDRRKELLDVLILDSSYELIEAESSSSVGYGTLNTDGDLNVADPYDRRRGRYIDHTKW